MILGDVRIKLLHFFWHIWNFFSVAEGDTDKSFIPPCRTCPRDESNGKSLLGNYIYLLDFRIIFWDVRSTCYTFWHIWNFFSAVECDTHKFFIPPYRTWPRDESNGKSLLGNYIYLLDFSCHIRGCKIKLLHFLTHLEFFLCSGGWHGQVFYTPV